MKKPLISIVIPSYNYGRYLRECLDSVIAQDYPHYEIVLVDDASTDASLAIANEYASKHPQIHVIANHKNCGLFKSAERGFAASKGDYIHFFAADDRYLPHFLSKSMEFFDKHPKAQLVCTDYATFEEGSDELKVIPLNPHWKDPLFLPAEKLAETLQTTPFWIAGASCITSRGLLETYGLLPPELENISDWFAFHRIAFYEGVGYIPEPLTSMRIHAETYTQRVKQDKKRRRAIYRALLDRLANEPPLRRQFLQGGLLNGALIDLKWSTLFRPFYWGYVIKKIAQKCLLAVKQKKQ